MLGSFLEKLRDARHFGSDFALKQLLAPTGAGELEVSVRNVGPLRLRQKSSDIEVVRQVFRERAYDLSGFPQYERVMGHYRQWLSQGGRPVIIDGGANNGAASRYFSMTYPDAIVVAVEPDDANARLCRINTADRRNVKVIQAAMGGAPGFVGLSNPEGEDWSIQTARAPTGAIRLYTVDELVKEVPAGRLFIVKIDIEGFEDDLFSSNLAWLDEALVVIIEPHDWLFPERASSRGFQREMASRDFDLLIRGENLIYVRR